MRAAVALEDLEQLEPSDAREAQPIDAHLLVAVHDGLVGPGPQARLNLSVRALVGHAEKAEGALREDYAEAECSIGRVLLDHADGIARVLPLEQQSQIETRGSATDDRHAHGCGCTLRHLRI